MAGKLSEEELKIIKGFGFLIDGETANHKKLDVQMALTEFEGFKTIKELQNFIRVRLQAT